MPRPLSPSTSYSKEKLKKKAGTILDLPTFFQTPEELILAKLRMIKATAPREKASKDEDDIKAILEFNKVNMSTIKRQARKNSTLSILETIRNDAVT